MSSSKNIPLSPDWEMKYDFSTKRNFFINHKTKVTTWADPRISIIHGTKSTQNEGLGINDFIDDDADIDKIIKMTEKEDEIDKDLKKLQDKYPEFDKSYIKELLLKSKSNVSAAEIILRQQRRKETSSIISYSTIDHNASGSKAKVTEGENTRFSLSERYKYDAPESSKDRTKSKLRSEFSNLDNRIVDRVLEVTDYSLEKSRNILRSKSKPIAIEENLRDNEADTRTRENLPSFKNFVTRRSPNSPEAKSSNDKSNISKRSVATGPNPKNYSGAQLNKNKFK